MSGAFVRLGCLENEELPLNLKLVFPEPCCRICSARRQKLLQEGNSSMAIHGYPGCPWLSMVSLRDDVGRAAVSPEASRKQTMRPGD